MGLLGIGVGAFATLGMGSIGVGMALGMAAVGLVISLILLYAMSFIVNAVSPNFNGKSDLASATKLMTYASTPSWIGGLIAPFLGPVGGVVSIAAIAYVVYLIYTGIRPVMEVPADKVAGFTVVIILIYIVLSLLLSMVIGGMLIATFFGGAMMAGAAGM
jgi:Yip1 domain